MRRSLACLLLFLSFLAFGFPAEAATGRVKKVLPLLVDLKGRHMVSPSLYERDAYQAYLRQHPELQSGMLYAVQWKMKGKPAAPLTLRAELRGIAQGNLPREVTLLKPVEPRGWFSNWTYLKLIGEAYQDFGEVTAWRVTLWEGDKLIGEQRSFLW